MVRNLLASFFDAILVPISRHSHSDRTYRLVLLSVVLAFLLIAIPACNIAQPDRSTPATPAGTPNPTATASPTPTPTPLPPRAVLLVPLGADEARAGILESALSELSGQDGLRYERLESLSPGDLTPDLRIVVALPPDPGLASLAAAAPGTQFLAMGIPGLEPGANLSVIRDSSEQPDRQGFLAGYLASVVTPDWRVGVIGSGDEPAGKAAINGFSNGVVYYCGLCRPAYPPFNVYPVSYELAVGASQAERQAAADALMGQGVTTVYLAPGAADPALLEYLAAAGLNLIGSDAPPAGVQEHWIATIRSDWAAALHQAWAGLIQGQTVDVQSLPVLITNVNENLFSLGRQGWVEQTRLDLNAGLIDPGVDPVSGENK